MANKPVYIYDKDCTDFSTSGLVGDIKPLAAFFDEEKNGISQVTIRLKYDKDGRWKMAKVGNIIKCEVPVRLPPVVGTDEFATTTKKYT